MTFLSATPLGFTHTNCISVLNMSMRVLTVENILNAVLTDDSGDLDYDDTNEPIIEGSDDEFSDLELDEDDYIPVMHPNDSYSPSSLTSSLSPNIIIQLISRLTSTNPSLPFRFSPHIYLYQPRLHHPASLSPHILPLPASSPPSSLSPHILPQPALSPHVLPLPALSQPSSWSPHILPQPALSPHVLPLPASSPPSS